MMKRSALLLLLTLAFASCTTDQLNQTAGSVLQATGNDNAKNRQILDASTKVVSAFAPLSYEKEREIGGGIAVQSFSTQGALYPDANVQRYVSLVGKTLAKHTTRPTVEFSFAVVQNDAINAWAAPGGYIFITTGLLSQVQDESELAGVLAHEMSHVTQYHMVKMLKRTQFMQGVAEGAQAGSKKVSLQQLTDAVNASSDVLFKNGFDRTMETEADALGVTVAASTGYDPNGLPRFLERTGQSQGTTGGGWLSSTHPPTADRVAALKTKIAKEFQGLGGATQAERFKANVGPLPKTAQ